MRRALLLLALAQAALAEADDVLKRFEGRWRTHVAISPAGITADGEGTGATTLGGAFVEYRARSGASEDLQVNFRDPATGKYHHWLFDSEGNRFARVGTLDATRKILTWTADEFGGTVVIHDRFVSPDRIEWDMVRRDRTGAVKMRIDAWMTRIE